LIAKVTAESCTGEGDFRKETHVGDGGGGEGKKNRTTI